VHHRLYISLAFLYMVHVQRGVLAYKWLGRRGLGETPWHWDYSPESDPARDYKRCKVVMYLDDLSAPGAGSLGCGGREVAPPRRPAAPPLVGNLLCASTAVNGGGIESPLPPP
jgi:hypothetical protein